jgi:hypothetical protein
MTTSEKQGAQNHPSRVLYQGLTSAAQTPRVTPVSTGCGKTASEEHEVSGHDLVVP